MCFHTWVSHGFRESALGPSCLPSKHLPVSHISTPALLVRSFLNFSLHPLHSVSSPVWPVIFSSSPPMCPSKKRKLFSLSFTVFLLQPIATLPSQMEAYKTGVSQEPQKHRGTEAWWGEQDTEGKDKWKGISYGLGSVTHTPGQGTGGVMSLLELIPTANFPKLSPCLSNFYASLHCRVGLGRRGSPSATFRIPTEVS